MKLETAHLSYEHGFVSIVVPDGDNIPCGLIKSDGCVYIDFLENEPDWFRDEFFELADLVDSERERLRREDRDYKSQINADYLRGKGAR